MKQKLLTVSAIKMDRYGWVVYPIAPNAVGNIVEDLELITRLIGSAQYEQKRTGNGPIYIRRAV